MIVVVGNVHHLVSHDRFLCDYCYLVLLLQSGMVADDVAEVAAGGVVAEVESESCAANPKWQCL